ncbi:DHH family phosphoesterase [Ichthyobacterium seriolicida]|uniref:Exopolyphosphatase n=1 Tax=Ichthyobacterium seriolicida TaxID=242600 RepID=A0A1J1E4G3_9FLAO|nr:DHH family phosphoesterase [Ichthyobacterium seriolicida]BAV94940.1 exopolyphosphatase [Ichthyobacterium seriolicida]
MLLSQIQEIKELLSSKKKISIISHRDPDGDALGSSLGLSHFLRNKDHHVSVIMPNKFPYFLDFIPGADSVIIYENNIERTKQIIEKSEIIFCLDFNSISRIGEGLGALIEKSNSIKIMIDHHVNPDNFPNYIYSDITACATCQLIYLFIEKIDSLSSIDKNIATCLYTGIMTDTGCFRFRSTNAQTHSIISNLINMEADNINISSQVYENNSEGKIKLLARGLENLILLKDYNTAYITLSRQELKSIKHEKGDTFGIVNYALSIKGVTLGVLMTEDKYLNSTKLSLRSKGSFSVNDMSAKYFNGGGHCNAAGGRIDKNITETVDLFKNVLKNYEGTLW